MAASPRFKVYDETGTYQAACKELEAAAALTAFYGEGSTIRLDHRQTVYTNGIDSDAGESYDEVAELALAKIRTKTEHVHSATRARLQ